MPKICEVYNKALQDGKEAEVLSSDIRLLIAHHMGFKEPIDTLLYKDKEMADLPRFYEDFARLLKGEPVEYIINEARFLQHRLFVDNRVLIPRMETEELVANITEEIDKYYDPRNYLVVADIGTGSGAVAIALKSAFKNWLITASDVSKEALEVAKKNFEKYASGIRTLEGPSLKPYIDANMNLDVIVSNPPYILESEEVQDSVKKYEPGLALWLDKERSVYEEIFRDYKKVKKGTLLMCFEIGPAIKDYLEDLMKKYLSDYEYNFIEDLNGRTRFLFVFCH